MMLKFCCRTLLLISALSFSGITAAQSQLGISNAKIKEVAQGAYSCTLDLKNNGAKAALLVAASSPQFGSVQLVKRDFTFSNGYSTLAGLIIDSGNTESLSRRGAQVLLTKPTQAISATELTLHFADNSSQSILLALDSQPAANAATKPSSSTQVVPTELEKAKPKKQKRYRKNHNPAFR